MKDNAMRFKYEKDKQHWVCFLNPYGDAWYSFGKGITKQEAKEDAIIQWNKYNASTDSNY